MFDFPSALFLMSFSSSFAFPPPRKLHNRLKDWKNRERWKWRDIELQLPHEKLYGRREEKIRLVAEGFTQKSEDDYPLPCSRRQGRLVGPLPGRKINSLVYICNIYKRL
jgi:hypothetical protein